MAPGLNRREFLIAFVATSVGVLAAPQVVLAETADTSVIAGTTMTVALLGTTRHGLPPSKRLFPLTCDGCGREIGPILADEDDRLPELYCHKCYEDAAEDARGEARMDAEEEALLEADDRMEDLRDDFLKALNSLHEQVYAIQADVRDGTVKALPRSLEHLSDALSRAHKEFRA